MSQINTTRVNALCITAALVASTMVTGCVSYSQARISNMATVDMCELSVVQGVNLSEETKRIMQSELQRRNESCTQYTAVLAERRAAFMYREMYGKHDDP
jgi:outer membrane murein-binding lipoprotein Lpp